MGNVFWLPPKLEHPNLIKLHAIYLTLHKLCLEATEILSSSAITARFSIHWNKNITNANETSASEFKHARACSHAIPWKRFFTKSISCEGSSWRQISTLPSWKGQKEKQIYYIYIMYTRQQKWKLLSHSFFPTSIVFARNGRNLLRKAIWQNRAVKWHTRQLPVETSNQW